jgi:hypothetical protein
VAKRKLQSAYPIGLTNITIITENRALMPYWKRLEDALYDLADRHKENPRELRRQLEWVTRVIDGQRQREEPPS